MIRIVKPFALSAIVILSSVFATAISQTCLAQEKEERLETKLRGPTTASGSAKFLHRPDRMKFSVEVEDAPPGESLLITVRRNKQYFKVGVMMVSKFGKGDFNLDSRKGDFVPMLTNNDVVHVWYYEKRILAGTLHPN